MVRDGALECVPKSGYIRSKAQFGDCQLHVEWAAPREVKGNSQGRGNSGIFLMGLVNTWFTAERTRALLAGRREGVANVMAAGLGIVTPFCSCSAVPLFIGFVQAGVPLGVTLSFLIAAPMVNEVALTLLFGLFGWRIAALYLSRGLLVAIVAGWTIGRLRMERHLQDWVRNIPRIHTTSDDQRLTVDDRMSAATDTVRDVVGRVWPYVIGGIAKLSTRTVQHRKVHILPEQNIPRMKITVNLT